MRSLRSRLFVMLLAAFVVAWAIALACLGLAFRRDQSGLRDRLLADIGSEVLRSMPGDVRGLSGAANLRPRENLPSQADGESHTLKGRFIFQLWIKPRRDLVVRSPSAPAAPLKPDLVDGYAQQTIDGEEWRVYALSNTEGDVQVQVAKPVGELAKAFRDWVLFGLGVSLLMLLVLGLAMRRVIHRSLRPVVAMRRTIAARDPLDLAPLRGGELPDEIRPLVDSFNQLLARLDRAMRNERQFLSEAAHELRTPLAALLTHAQVAQRSKTPEEAAGPLRQLVQSAERSARLSQQLLDSARLDAERSAQRTAIELADIVAVVTHELDTIAAHKRQSIALDAEPCAILGNVDDLGILIGNLVDNAVRYTPHGGRIAVRCLASGSLAQLQVLDDGPGVAAADRERIFDRFFRVAGSSQRGSGLGLSLVARIAAAHGAAIVIGDGLDGRGFGITVSFPLLPAVPRGAAPALALVQPRASAQAASAAPVGPVVPEAS
jgi:signal transduction histidine kinase